MKQEKENIEVVSYKLSDYKLDNLDKIREEFKGDRFWLNSIVSDIYEILNNKSYDNSAKLRLLTNLFIEERRETARFAVENVEDALNKIREIIE